MKAWYLLYCKSRGEARAQQNLALQQIDTYLPTYPEEKLVKGQSTVKRVSLFPSYLFINFDPEITSVSKIHNTRGVIRIVGCKELMTPIDDSIIHAIKMREHKLISELSPKESSATLEPAMERGDKVCFTEGPFSELEGIFDEANGEKRCFVLFDLMGKQQRVAVNKSTIKPVK
ncbi:MULTISPECIES: transcription/translation regulatory transformer protein RfaH [unclassified Shewanella]|uniref:transcription/translation regulatory transformer protein RfaH n=1 Tax=unclassified Shewanella TaxID=196818 RepID=UPI001BC6A218|nr:MULTISPECIES: transcription/translation regulatory transformer protein RfaH [unclassified Shewanella]GIU18003.1 transcription antitermination protein RfaH [Shewanella sp. MBTL60-112-B1]GIU40817.1 transcription antitermination protein RfaH [Shewanella sp. MBTL60-112-B2]